VEPLIHRLTNTIARDVERIDNALREKDAVREELIKLTREIIRLSGSAINSVHGGKQEEAKSSLLKARELVEKLLNLVERHHDLKYSGLTYNGLSEYVEAHLFYSIVVESNVPAFDELKVPIVPYLQGLGDLVGELRRLIIKLLNELRISEAEKYLNVMEAIYSGLRLLDYPDPLIPGVRHKVDIAFRLLEDTRVLILSTKNSVRCMETRKVENYMSQT